MSLFGRARRILQTHGPQGLARRASAKARRYALARLRAGAQRRAWERLVAHVRSGPVYFPRHDAPVVSIIVIVSAESDRIAPCLNGILRQLDSLPCEVIVVDDAAGDRVRSYLATCSGIQIIRHDLARGFVYCANAATMIARGRYLHFLDERAIVTPGWLAPLLRTFESENRVGAVASQLRAPNGTIEHAGGIVWRDGSTAAYGKGERPSYAGAAFPREVDYGSIASLMVRADLFTLGTPGNSAACAQDANLELCFRIREAGYRVVYQPASVVVFFDTASARTRTPQTSAFADTWRTALARHYPPDELLIERAARRIAGVRTALVMDSFVPFDDRSAGARRMLEIMRILRESGWHVIFVADDGGTYEPYTTRARRLGIEVLPHRGDAIATLRSLAVPIDVAWIVRPDVLSKYLPVLRASTRAPIVYDTVDLHFVRRKREECVRGYATHWEAMQSIELGLAKKVETTVVTSDAESSVLAEYGIASIVVPIVESRTEWRPPYAARHELLFLGNYTHEPNVDAARWIVEEIMPLVRERLPDAHLTLAGADPTPAVLRLASDRIAVTGHVEDLGPLFCTTRVFIAPLRYGAGMKGKIVQSIAHGVPVVTTTIGAEGIGLRDGVSALIRDDAAGCAAAIVELYNDERLWKQIADGGFEVAGRYEPRAVAHAVERALETALHHEERVGVDLGTTAHTA